MDGTPFPPEPQTPLQDQPSYRKPESSSSGMRSPQQTWDIKADVISGTENVLADQEDSWPSDAMEQDAIRSGEQSSPNRYPTQPEDSSVYEYSAKPKVTAGYQYPTQPHPEPSYGYTTQSPAPIDPYQGPFGVVQQRQQRYTISFCCTDSENYSFTF